MLRRQAPLGQASSPLTVGAQGCICKEPVSQTVGVAAICLGVQSVDPDRPSNRVQRSVIFERRGTNGGLERTPLKKL